MYKLKPSDREIDKAIEEASDAVNDGRTKFPGATYESGVDAALRWAIGEEENHPLAD